MRKYIALIISTLLMRIKISTAIILILFLFLSLSYLASRCECQKRIRSVNNPSILEAENAVIPSNHYRYWNIIVPRKGILAVEIFEKTGGNIAFQFLRNNVIIYQSPIRSGKFIETLNVDSGAIAFKVINGNFVSNKIVDISITIQ